MKALPEYVEKYGFKNLYIACDEITYGIAGEKVMNILKDAGIKKGFIIMVVNDQKISSPEQLEKIVDKVLKGSENDRYIVVKGFYPNGRTKVYAIDLAE